MVEIRSSNGVMTIPKGSYDEQTLRKMLPRDFAYPWTEIVAVTQSDDRKVQAICADLRPHFNPALLNTDPTSEPSRLPSSVPTNEPTNIPSMQPTQKPSSKPSKAPSFTPTHEPSSEPSKSPSNIPSFQPTKNPTMRPSTTSTELPSPNLVENVSIVLQVRGLKKQNTRAICRSVADAVRGNVEYCSPQPRSPRRNLEDNSSLYMELTVSDADSALSQIQSESFISTLENLPNEVSISNIDISDDTEKDLNPETSNAREVMTIIGSVAVILAFAL
jgi:hypothetical protein